MGGHHITRKENTMLDLRSLKIDPTSLGVKKLLVDVSPAYDYKDGKRTQTIGGYKYTVGLPEHGLEKIGVKIDGKRLMEKPEDSFTDVEFSGLEVFVYWAQGQYHVGARATGISIVGKKA